MKKIIYLGTCSTCKRIIKDLDLKSHDFEFQDIKVDKITVGQLDELKELAGTYEALFSRTAMKYKSLGLKEMILSETDYKNYILEEYTFLKRPVIVIGNKIFIGNSKPTIASVQSEILSLSASK